jgi:uncharacterized protein (DUF1778 family)
MASTTTSGARLNFRLPADLKRVIEEAASQLGQSVSEFAVSTLVQQARKVVHERNVTELSNRDRDIFLAALEKTDAKPNKALVEAAKGYKKQVK